MEKIIQNESKHANAVRFIEAAQELIDTEGIELISIRKIADKAGFHNSTLYLYFQNADQLIMLASLKYFQEYSLALEKLSKTGASAINNFYSIWAFFSETVFQKPNIFYNFFFGKYSDDLTNILKQYYLLFPNEQKKYSAEIEKMYYARNIYQRSLLILTPLMEDPKTRLNAENLDLINDIIISCLKSLLEEKCRNLDLSVKDFTTRLLAMIHLVIDTNS